MLHNTAALQFRPRISSFSEAININLHLSLKTQFAVLKELEKLSTKYNKKEILL